MQEASSNSLDIWALVELFGHNRIAGHCTETNIAGTVFLRVDVPNKDGSAGFTRFFHGNAVYAINPVDEAIARELAGQMDKAPVQTYDVPLLMQKMRPAAPVQQDGDFEEDEPGEVLEDDLNL
jgi:hypothetical protein